MLNNKPLGKKVPSNQGSRKYKEVVEGSLGIRPIHILLIMVFILFVLFMIFISGLSGESWECTEWRAPLSMTGENIVTKDDFHFVQILILTELRRCNDTWECLWDEGLVMNNTQVSLYETMHGWKWSVCELNSTSSLGCHEIDSLEVTDDNCTKWVKVKT